MNAADRRLGPAERGMRLDRFLALSLPDLSRSHLKRLIERGLVLVDGRSLEADYRLRGGEEVVLQDRRGDWTELSIEDWVLHEDPVLLVLNKPAGLLMHPAGDSWTRSPEAALAEPEATVAGLLFLRRLGRGREAPPRCGLVHRLDRETSGVLLAAKTRAAQAALTAAFAGRRVEKTYRAVVWGELGESVEVSAPVASRGAGRAARVSAYGREAKTAFTVLGRAKGLSLVEARPVTGRTHQIRAHLSYLGHPVVGDHEGCADWTARLAEAGLPPAPRMLLHAWKLAFDHPKTGRRVAFRAPMPKDLASYWKAVSAG